MPPRAGRYKVAVGQPAPYPRSFLDALCDLVTRAAVLARELVSCQKSDNKMLSVGTGLMGGRLSGYSKDLESFM